MTNVDSGPRMIEQTRLQLAALSTASQILDRTKLSRAAIEAVESINESMHYVPPPPLLQRAFEATQHAKREIAMLTETHALELGPAAWESDMSALRAATEDELVSQRDITQAMHAAMVEADQRAERAESRALDAEATQRAQAFWTKVAGVCSLLTIALTVVLALVT